MREKARDLIYLDTNRYISLKSLRTLSWTIIFIPFLMGIWGIIGINTIGVSFRSLFPLISAAVWSLLYWIFVLAIQAKKKKTFELRFLVNGILGLLISSLFWILYASLSLIADNPIMGFDFLLWILFFYLFFSAFYIGSVVLGVHKGIFKKIKEKSQTPKALAISAFFGAILPGTGAIGMWASRAVRNHASVSAQNIITTIAFILVIFLPALAHINFVQYFYCKKYKILCDEDGNTTSPDLEVHAKTKKIKQQREEEFEPTPVFKAKRKKEEFEPTHISYDYKPQKGIPRIIKILIVILGIPIALCIVLFWIFFIKAFIQGFIQGIT